MEDNKRIEEIIAAMEKEIDYWHKLASSYGETVQNLIKVNARMEWHATKDRLPNFAGFYVVAKRQKTGSFQISFGHFDGKGTWSGNGNFNDVIAWLEVPILPEKIINEAEG